jgi:crotonobetainyl-CoA:carnitine CoA-transferase CaiB-like acyl-CoA transferase
MRIELAHPLAGMLPLLGSPLRLSDTPVEYRLPPPLLGQHTDEVLGGLLGMEGDELSRLRQSGVV